MKTGRRQKSLVVERLGVLAALAPLISGCAVPAEEVQADDTPAVRFETSIDPGGCVLEHVAVERGTNQYLHDGVSPDGSVLAVAWDRGEADRGTYLLNLATGQRTDLPGLNNVTAFAPSGKTLVSAVYVDDGKNDIFEYDHATGEMSVIAQHEEWDWLPSYSSNGDFIVFNSYRSGGSDIYTYHRASGELERRTDDPRYEAHAQFSPDDSKILFHRQVDEGNFDVFVLEVGSGEISQLTHDETEEGYASWSPDGQTIVFASDRDQTPGKTDLYLMQADGSKIRQLTDHPAKDAYPFSSPDGRYIYFNAYRDPPGIYRISLAGDLECVTSSEQSTKVVIHSTFRPGNWDIVFFDGIVAQ